jgi:hypothetical protein
MIALALLLPLAAPPCPAPAQVVVPAGTRAIEAFDHDHATWTAVLKRHVKERGVDYAGLKRERGELDRYLATLRAVRRADYEAWSEAQRHAFWLNAYNAHVTAVVVDGYPTSSIQSLGTLLTSVWKREAVPLGHLHPKGARGDLSLDEVEHGILRPVFRDARVNAALGRASQSGPQLAAEAFAAERLDAQLDARARAWLADDTRNRFDRTGTKLYLAKDLDTHRKDFVRDAGSVQTWVARYAPPEHRRWVGEAKKIEVEYLPVSWALDDASGDR